MTVPDHTALSWRDVYRAVSESEERIISAVKEATGPLRATADDHEGRLRRLENEGSLKAQDAHRAADAIGIKLDALTLVVNANTNARKGSLDALSVGQKIIVFGLAVLGGIAIFLDLFAKYFGGT